jgi:hypothetical protein
MTACRAIDTCCAAASQILAVSCYFPEEYAKCTQLKAYLLWSTHLSLPITTSCLQL